uniref:Phosphoesterase n=1 Tax=Ignisphaera aggregans TaxID=334771 RepID=A0A7C2V8Y7_9CREN
MLLGVMSDSHDNVYAIEDAIKVFREHDVDIVIHLGDVISPFALSKILEYPAKLIVVTGNNDGDILQLKEIASKGGAVLKQHMFVTNISNKRFLLMHGFGSREQTRGYAEAMALTGSYDVVLYGHTHEAVAYFKNKVLVLNPGEVCGYITGRRTIALIDVDTLSYELVEF